MNSTLNNSNIIYPDLSYSVVGAAMDVHNALKPGWDEWDYHRALVVALEDRGHSVASHCRRNLIYRELQIDKFELDLLVDDLIVLELKHSKDDFHPVHFTQIINYLKCWDKRLGLLVNFGQEKLRYKRVPFSCPDAGISHTGEWAGISNEIQALMDGAIGTILSEVGSGYGADVFKKLLIAELSMMGAGVKDVCLAPEYNGQYFEKRVVDALSVGEDLMVGVSALSSATDLSYLKTYMKWTGMRHGVLVNLDSTHIELRGVV